VHRPLQGDHPLVQVHDPAVQTKLLLVSHVFVQLPQCCEFVCRSTQPPLQGLNPPLHCSTQAPPWQAWLPVHRVPQLWQLSGSLNRSLHASGPVPPEQSA
jgi:hypothetical protein